MKAVVKINNSQYLVEEGLDLVVDRMDIGENAVFSQVLMTISDDQVQVGNPVVPDVGVHVRKISDFNGDKVRTFKYKAKSRYRKAIGFRPRLTKLKVTGIGNQPAEAPVTRKTVGKKIKTSSEKNS